MLTGRSAEAAAIFDENNSSNSNGRKTGERGRSYGWTRAEVVFRDSRPEASGDDFDNDKHSNWDLNRRDEKLVRSSSSGLELETWYVPV